MLGEYSLVELCLLFFKVITQQNNLCDKLWCSGMEPQASGGLLYRAKRFLPRAAICCNRQKPSNKDKDLIAFCIFNIMYLEAPGQLEAMCHTYIKFIRSASNAPNWWLMHGSVSHGYFVNNWK